MNQMVKRLSTFTVFLAFFLSSAVRAEDLKTAWQDALRNDPLIKASQSEVSAATADLGVARAARLPHVSATAGITRFDEMPAFDFSGAGVPALLPLFGGESLRMADARISLPIYAGGQLTLGIDAAEATLSVRQSHARASAQEVKLAVARDFINVLRSESELAVADSNVTSLAAHLRDVESMFKSGSVAQNDYLAAAVSLADSEQRRLQANNRLDLAKAAYNRALGRSLDTPVSLDDELPDIDPKLDLESLESLTAIALGNRDELAGLDASVDAYRNQSESARRGTRPQLAVTGGYIALQNDFLNREEFWMVGIGVRWNLFDAGQAREKASALLFRSKAVAQQRDNLRSLIELQVRQSWLRLNETRERKRVTARAVEQAEENLRVVRDRYRNGEGTNTEVLDAEVLRRLSRSNFDNADFDAKLALYELARGVGRL